VSADPSQQKHLVNRMPVADLQSAARVACDAATLGAEVVNISQDRCPPNLVHVTVQWPSTGLQQTFEAWWSDARVRSDLTRLLRL
jgi:hypothetical protein